MPKERNPGWIPGDHWVNCSVCGFNYRASECRRTWDNRIVCKYDYEPRQAQDFVRGREEDTSAKGLVQPEPEAINAPAFCKTRLAVAGIAVASCAIVSYSTDKKDYDIPPSTFENSL